MSSGDLEESVLNTTTRFPKSCGKISWDIEDFDSLVSLSHFDVTSSPLKIECAGVPIEWVTRLKQRRDRYNVGTLVVSLQMHKSTQDVNVLCAYEILLGEPGLDCKKEKGQDWFYGRINNTGSFFAPDRRDNLEVSLSTVTGMRNKYYPGGVFRITVNLAVYMDPVHKTSAAHVLRVEATRSLGKWAHDLYSNSLLSDVAIECNGKVFKVHKCILGQSTVFSAMFASGMKEACTNEVTVSDVDPVIFELFLKFLYGIPFDVPKDHKELVELLNCAEKYDLASLKAFCLNTLESMINDQNAGELNIVAHTFCQNDEFRKRIKNFCLNRHNTLIANPEYKQLLLKHPEMFL